MGFPWVFFPKSLPKAFKKFTVETSAVLKKHKESTEARDIFACRHTLPESVERAAASVSALPGVVETGVQVRTASGGEDGGGGELLRLHKLNLHISKTEKNSLNPVSNNRCYSSTVIIAIHSYPTTNEWVFNWLYRAVLLLLLWFNSHEVLKSF